MRENPAYVVWRPVDSLQTHTEPCVVAWPVEPVWWFATSPEPLYRQWEELDQVIPMPLT
jgi:hypothetical protein